MSSPQAEAAFRNRAMELSTLALHSAQLNDWERSGAAVATLNDELGGEGIMFAIVAWCDTLIMRQQQVLGHKKGDLARPAWLNADTGDLALNADDVPPPVRWAGRLVAARAAMDHDVWQALVDSTPDTPGATTEHVSVLLTSIATTLNALSRIERGGAA